MKKLFYILVLVAIGLFVGLLLHRSGEELDPDLTETEGSAIHRSQRSLQNGSSAREARERRSRQSQDDPEFWLRWVSHLENLPLKDLPAFYEGLESKLKAGGSSFSSEDRLLLEQYWSEIDAADLLAYAGGLMEEGPQAYGFDNTVNSLMQRALGVLLKEDRERTVELLSESNIFPGQERLRSSALRSLMAEDPAFALKLASQWKGREPMGWLGLSGKLKKWANKNPQQAAEAILSEPYLAGQDRVLKLAAGAFAKRSPQAAIEYGRSHKGGYGAAFAKEAFRTWVKDDLASSGEWLINHQDERVYRGFLPVMVKAWGENSPREALVWAEEHLKGSSLQGAMESIVGQEIRKNPASAYEILASIQDPEMRKVSALVVAQSYFSDPNPEDNFERFEKASAWIDLIDDPATFGQVFNMSAHSWVEQDRESFQEQIKKVGDQISPHYLEYVIETLAIDDSEKTLAWSAEVSVDYERVSARVVFAQMMERDQVSALAWSRDLPPERAHLYPYLMGVVNLDFTEEQFSEGTKEMSVEDRAEFRRLLEATAR
jgi:hypothetical protein